MVGLVGTELWDTQVFGLVLGKGGQLDSEHVQVGLGDLLIELLGQHVDSDGVLGGLGPELDLGKDLVGEGVAHDKGRVTHGTSQVDKTAFSKEDHTTTALEGVTVNLGLDSVALDRVLLKPGGIDLAVKMADVADNGIVQHLLEVTSFDDVLAASGGNKNTGFRAGFIHGGDLITLHSSLQGVDGVDLCHHDSGTESPEGLCASFSNISVSGDDGDSSGQHDVGGTFDAVDERLAAAVEVIELALSDGIVYVNGGDLEFS